MNLNKFKMIVKKNKLEKKLGISKLLKTYYNKFNPFYRNYNYSNEILITTIDHFGMIDFDLGFFYNRIPKAANTVTCIKLAKLKHGKNYNANKNIDYVKNGMFKKPSGLSLNEMSIFDELFKFIFVRNPYTRVLSAYLHKIVQNKGIYDVYLGEKLGYTPSFKEFCIYLKNEGLFTNVHWAPQTSLLLLPPQEFDYIGKIEKFESDFSNIEQRIKSIGSNKKTSIDRVHSTNANEKLRKFYDKETKELVNKMYKTDFKIFKYNEDLI